MEKTREEKQRMQEFLDLVVEASETDDKTKLAIWWREHFPGWQWWLIGPCCLEILPDLERPVSALGRG